MAQIINTAEFETKVLNGQGVALVDFYADWCGPCKMMSPAVDKLSEEFSSRAAVYKINTDADGALAAGLGIMSIPTLIFFKDGEEKDRVVGVVTEDVLRGKLESLC